MKLERLLAIVMLLVGKRRVQAQELAERFEVSVRTIYRDIETINQAGIPVVTYQGAGGGIGLAEGYRIDRSFLTPDELAAVFIALKGATSYHDMRAQAVLEKIQGMVPDSQSDAFRAKAGQVVIDLAPWGGSPILRQKLGVLREAIAGSQRVRFTYGGARGDFVEREVEPYVLMLRGQHWYLYGFCRLRRAFRLFRLSRMKELAGLTETFVRQEIDLEQEPPWDPEWTRPGNVVDMVLRFDARVRTRAEDYFGAESVLPLADGGCEARVSYPEDDWVYGFILSFGPWVEVVSPVHMRQRIAEMAASIGARYS